MAVNLLSPETFLTKICMVSRGSGEAERDVGVEERMLTGADREVVVVRWGSFGRDDGGRQRMEMLCLLWSLTSRITGLEICVGDESVWFE